MTCYYYSKYTTGDIYPLFDSFDLRKKFCFLFFAMGNLVITFGSLNTTLRKCFLYIYLYILSAISNFEIEKKINHIYKSLLPKIRPTPTETTA